MHRILALWAHPRSLSTVLERVFIERGDFAVLHEPFSVVYYMHEQRAAAVAANFDSQESADYGSVRERILREADHGPVCFKDMCYHCYDHLRGDEAFLKRLTNVFLIRDPKQTIASHFAKNPAVTKEEIGYECQADLFRQLKRLTGAYPVVIAAEALQRDPAGTMRVLCNSLGLDNRPDALSWQPGPRKEWDTWKEWHREATHSDSIRSSQTDYRDTVDNHTALAGFYRHHRPFYDEMRQHCITAEAS